MTKHEFLYHRELDEGEIYGLPKVRQWRTIDTMDNSLYTIVETRPFIQDAKSRLTDTERVALIEMIATNPTCGDLLEGTGGIRKVRFAVQGRGKSGGVRVIYYFHSEKLPIFLLAIFAKNEKDNLSKAERNELAKLVIQLVETYGK